jgi:hypothetical protein
LAQFQETTLTNQGLQILAATQAGGEVKFTHIAFSDVSLAGELAELTQIPAIKQTLAIEGYKASENEPKASVWTTLTGLNLDEGYFLRSAGLYCQDPNDPQAFVLYAVTTVTPDTSTSGLDYFLKIVPAGSSMALNIRFTLNIRISAAASIIIDANPDLSGFVRSVNFILPDIEGNVNISIPEPDLSFLDVPVSTRATQLSVDTNTQLLNEIRAGMLSVGTNVNINVLVQRGLFHEEGTLSNQIRDIIISPITISRSLLTTPISGNVADWSLAASNILRLQTFGSVQVGRIRWQIISYINTPTPTISLYAELNENNICYGVKMVGPIPEDSKSIKICDVDENTVLDDSYIGKLYDNGEWIEQPTSSVALFKSNEERRMDDLENKLDTILNLLQK